jgi:hypothetical protein
VNRVCRRASSSGLEHGQGRAAVVGLGVAVLSALAAAPASADSSEVRAEGEAVSQATANALNLSTAGHVAGSGGFVAVNDGALGAVKGVQVPELPLIDDQQIAAMGVLAQDAATSTSGYAAACAGIVGGNGAIDVGADGTCMISGDGKIQISLGTLDQLGLSALAGGQLPGLPALPDLPTPGDLPLPTDLPDTGDLPATGNLPVPGDLPVPAVPDLPLPDLASGELGLDSLTGLALPTGGLPDIELLVVGQAITAKCLSTPTDTFGEVTPVDAHVVAVVAGQQIPVADIQADSLDLTLTDVLSKVHQQLPAQASGVLDQILAAVPANQIDAVQLANIQVGAQTAQASEIAVTGLSIETALPGLLDVELAKVTCSSNAAASGSADSGAHVQAGAAAGGANAGADVEADESGARAGAGAAAEAGPANGAGAVSAEIAPTANTSTGAAFGWGAVIALMLAGLGLAGLKFRHLIRH